MGSEQILLVEDCPEIQVMVRAALSHCFQISIVDSVASALQMIQEKHFDLFLVDVVLPDGDGFYLCSELRTHARTKSSTIFFLTSRSESKDKVMGFSIGADDYIVKPFDPLELRARVSARLKKNAAAQFLEETLYKGHFRLQLSSYRAFCVKNEKTEDLRLSPHEFRLLLYLIRHEGHVLSREQLLDSVWGEAVNVCDRTVDTHVCNLRKKLSTNCNHIESVFGEGYRFHAVVNES